MGGTCRLGAQDTVARRDILRGQKLTALPAVAGASQRQGWRLHHRLPERHRATGQPTRTGEPPARGTGAQGSTGLSPRVSQQRLAELSCAWRSVLSPAPLGATAPDSGSHLARSRTAAPSCSTRPLSSGRRIGRGRRRSSGRSQRAASPEPSRGPCAGQGDRPVRSRAAREPRRDPAPHVGMQEGGRAGSEPLKGPTPGGRGSGPSRRAALQGERVTGRTGVPPGSRWVSVLATRPSSRARGSLSAALTCGTPGLP